MKKYPHTCSCGNKYTDEDPDGYFCPSCVEQRKIIAKEVDEKLKGRVSKRAVKTDLQIAMEKGITKQSASGGFATFVRASDLGL
jgi:hypothetical protein